MKNCNILISKPRELLPGTWNMFLLFLSSLSFSLILISVENECVIIIEDRISLLLSWPVQYVGVCVAGGNGGDQKAISAPMR